MAESQTLNFLKALPDDYFVLRELKTLPTLKKQRAGSVEDRIDLVVIGSEVGVVVLEVKDWNIRRNTYEWIDQYNVNRIDEKGKVERLRNPFAQVDEYYQAIYQILRAEVQNKREIMRVNGFVVYPKLARAEFENAFERGVDTRKAGLQEKYLLDSKRTIFCDDLDSYWDNPLKLLSQLVKAQIKTPYTDAQITEVMQILMPQKLRVGDSSGQNSGYKNLLLMDEDQQKWAFSEKMLSKNYMLDVAGSGKTNVLLTCAEKTKVNSQRGRNTGREWMCDVSTVLWHEVTPAGYVGR